MNNLYHLDDYRNLKKNKFESQSRLEEILKTEQVQTTAELFLTLIKNQNQL